MNSKPLINLPSPFRPSRFFFQQVPFVPRSPAATIIKQWVIIHHQGPQEK